MEIDPVSLHDERAGRDSDPAGPLRTTQQEMTIRMFDALQTKGVVFVGQAPPAFGKTVVIRAVTLALVESGRRVLIAEPTYSRLDELGRYLRGVGIEPRLLRGRSKFIEDGLECPVIKGEPNFFWCRDQHELEKKKGAGCKGFDCPIKEQERTLEGASVAVAVSATLVRHDGWLDGFDVAVFDESHTLPGILQDARVKRLDLTHVKTLADFFPDLAGFTKALDTLQRLQRRPEPREIGPNVVNNMFENSIRKVATVVRSRIQAESRRAELPAAVTNAIHNLEGMASAVDRSAQYKFTGYAGAIYAAPPARSLTFRESSKKADSETSIALISATIENPKFHVNDSGFGRMSLVAPYEYPHDPLVEMSERRIFSLIDGPILRVSGDESDKQARQLANEIIIQVLTHLRCSTLILCRSERDRRQIGLSLKENPTLSPRVLELDDEEFEDADRLEHFVRERMNHGQDLVVATASSKLWEGANLEIQLLIIDSLPYTAPDPWSTQRESWLTSKPFRTMLRRFQQGIGRLIRGENRVGVAVVVDGRLHAQWRMMNRLLPEYVRRDIHATRRDFLLNEIDSFMREASERVAQGRIRAGQLRQVRFTDYQSKAN